MDKSFIWTWAFKNIVAIVAWTALAILFDKWWIALFALLFLSDISTKTKSYRICDGCGKYGPYANSYNEALDKAKEAGWVHYVDGARDYCPECAEKERSIIDKPLLTQNLYNTIIADNNKFKAYWSTHPKEVEEICRKFSEKFTENERCKYLKVEKAPLSCEEGFVYPGDKTFCLKKDRKLLNLFECEGCEYKERPTSD